MSRLFRLSDTVRRDPDIEVWMQAHPGALGDIERQRFGIVRSSGDDVREIMNDGCPVACAADAAFAYVNAFTVHVNVGFFNGAILDDPDGLLQGTGEFMRHVKLRPETGVDAGALARLIQEAYFDVKRRLKQVHDPG